MNKNGFVILHYMTIDDTINCTESILKNVKNPIIVIVDNGSVNGTGKKLMEIYRDNVNVKVILNKDNLGFAKGNNIGISYLNNNFLCDFITVLNNDTLILKSNFINIVTKEYNRSGFAVLGPKIYTLNNDISSNPVEIITDTKEKVIVLVFKKIIKLLLSYFYLNKFINTVGNNSKCYGLYNNNQRYENVKLHGACWIFSKKYFDNFNGLNDRTFLYFEEDILYIELMNKKLKTVYLPDIEIKHIEDSSTNFIARNSRKKNIFVLKNEIRSLFILLSIIRNRK